MARLTSGIIGALLLAMPVAAADLPPLSQDAHVTRSLLAAAVGDEIRKNCPTISARLFRALTKAKALERYALNKGYTEDQIEAFLDSKDERARMTALRDAYLAQNGVVPADADSYCRLGLAEIERGSLTGSLLRAR